MSTGTSGSPIVETDVIDFLSRHDGLSALENACDLVRNCFPELASIRVRFLEDPDLQVADGARRHLQTIGRLGKTP